MKFKLSTGILSLLIGAFLSQAGGWTSVYADFSVLNLTQTESVVGVPTQGVKFIQPLGTGVSGSATGAQFHFNVSVGSGGDLWSQMQIMEFTTESAYDNCVNGVSCTPTATYTAGGFPQNQFTGTGAKVFTWNGSTGTLDGYTFNASYWYIARLDVMGWTGTSLTASLGGSTAQLFADACVSGSPSDGDCLDVLTLALSMQGVSVSGFSGDDASTRIVQVSPADQEVVSTSTPVQLWAMVNINIDDWIDSDDWFLRFKYVRQENLQSAVACIECLYTSEDIPIETWPNFEIIDGPLVDFATLEGAVEGEYIYIVEIRKTSLVNNILGWFGLENLYDPGKIASSRSTFIVEQRTTLDQFIFDMASTTESILGDPGIFADVGDSCNPISGFDFMQCISGLLIPNGPQMDTAVNTLKQQVLVKAPVGYITRLIEIIGGSATSTLPEISYTFGSGPLEGQEFAFDFNGTLTQANTILTEEWVSDQEEPQNIWDIFMPLWNILVYAVLIVMMVSQITGIYHNQHKKL